MSALVQRLTGLTLADPEMLWGALLVPLALLAAQARRGAALRLAPAQAAGLSSLNGDGAYAPLPGSWRTRLCLLPALLQGLGLLALVVALARPQARQMEPVASEGLDLMLAFDTSSSMTARDLARGRTRLEVAREAAQAFVARRPEDRIGLLAFARYPDLVCPLTRDHEALRDLLARVGTVSGDGPEDATGIGAAVARAAQTLGAAPSRSKVVVLLTDGEENVAVAGAQGAIAPSHAAQLAQRLGVRVHVIVVGSPDAPGRPAVDTRPVQRLAEATGGRLFPAAAPDDLEAVYTAIDGLERSPLAVPRSRLADRYLPFLALGLALLLLGRALGASVLEVAP